MKKSFTKDQQIDDLKYDLEVFQNDKVYYQRLSIAIFSFTVLIGVVLFLLLVSVEHHNFNLKEENEKLIKKFKSLENLSQPKYYFCSELFLYFSSHPEIEFYEIESKNSYFRRFNILSEVNGALIKGEVSCHK